MSITTTHDVRQSLVAQDSEFRRLSEQHSLCELELEQITNSVYLSAEDLLQAGSKLGVSRDEIVSMLDRSGFYQSHGRTLVGG